MSTPAFLVIDKPPGITSHDVVAVLRAVTGTPKVGHTGTLDPFATGVLPLAMGRSTRFIRFLDERLKVYDATVALGKSTTTGDPEGEVLREGPPADLERLDAVLAGFVGPRMQTPPAYSAVKVQGKPLYKYARQGEAVEVAARPIEIFSMIERSRSADEVRVEIHCTRGTYARVLADELAVELGTAGHLSALRRLRSGPFTLEGAITMEQLSELVAGDPDWQRVLRSRLPREERVPWNPRGEVVDALRARAVTLEDALAHLPAIQIHDAVRARILAGGKPPGPPEGLAPEAPWALWQGEELVAVAAPAGGSVKLVFAVER